jgi:hypothetical protein
MKEAEAFLRENNITQYWARPKSPKEKPYVERLIGTLQRECLDYHYEPMNVGELSRAVDAWLDKAPTSKPESFDVGDTSTAPMNPSGS